MAKEFIQENESKTDIAYRLLLKRKKEVGFYELWNLVKKELAKVLTEEQMANIDEDISFFYTNLTLDGRFFQVGDNKWNLRDRIKYEDIEKRMSNYDIYNDDSVEESEEDDKEDEEEREFGDDFDDSYDDSTGSDADIFQYRERGNSEDEDEDL